MDVIEYVKAFKRMCRSRECINCPLWRDTTVPFTKQECFNFRTRMDTENTVKFLEMWCKEHPEERTCKYCKHYRTLYSKFGETSGGCTVESGLITEVYTEDSCERFKRKENR